MRLRCVAVAGCIADVLPGQRGERRAEWRISISVLRNEMLDGIGIEGLNSVTEGSHVAKVLPAQCGERGAQWCNWRIQWFDEHALMVELQEAMSVCEFPLNSLESYVE